MTDDPGARALVAHYRFREPVPGRARPMVVLLDIDRFKAVNDAHGHPTGDDVIRGVAERLAAVLGPGDLLGRYGGEEFALLVGDDGLPERLRAAVAEAAIPTRSGPLAVTVSVGVARADGPAGTGLEAALAAADRALYEAKVGGRNRVAVS